MPREIKYGYLLPEKGDMGDALCEALEQTLEQLVCHTHDGDNSSPIDTTLIDKPKAIVSAVNWSDDGSGCSRFCQSVSAPIGVDLSNTVITIRDSDGNVINPTIKGLGGSLMQICVNDPTLNLTVTFG